MQKQDHIAAHTHCTRHGAEIKSSERCGCFYCLKVFAPSAIEKWIETDESGGTACCPYCEIDSVIGSKSGYPITKEFLKTMHDHWF